jgi:phage gp36-like protein
VGQYITHELDGTTRDLEAVAGVGVIAGIVRDLPSQTERQATVDAKIDAAESLADSYLRARYTVPVASPPSQLIEAVAVIAARSLYRGPAPEHVRTCREDAVAWLRDVSTGKAALPGISLVSETSSTSAIRSSTNARLLTRDLLDW